MSQSQEPCDDAGAGANGSAAEFCPQRQHLAEPLWFALMCRELFGTNAAKELQFILAKSDRTCRAWAAGDSEPPATILAALIVSKHGLRVIRWIVRGSVVVWWSNVERALRVAVAVDGALAGLGEPPL